MKLPAIAHIVAASILIPKEAKSINASPHSFHEKQPDGTDTPSLFAHGSSKFHYLTDSDGYTILQDDLKYYVYATKNEDTGRLVSSGLRVGSQNPAMNGIMKGAHPNDSVVMAQCGDLCHSYDNDGRRALMSSGPQQTAAVGTLKNLVVLMQFSDHTSRTLPTTNDVDILMNRIGGDPDIAPTGSIRDVYHQSSYGQLLLDSDVRAWVTLPETEAYYSDGNYGLTNAIVEAIHSALDLVDEDPTLSFQDFDEDNDGYIDAITFLHSGYGAEWGATDCDGQSSIDRVWSHKWTMPRSLHWTSSDGVTINKYHISPALWGTCGSDIGRIGVIAHELGHFLGLPDLYDGDGGDGIGSYGLMSNSWGFDGSQLYPPVMSPWSKIQLGWLTPSILAGSGSYSLSAAGNTAQVYRIDAGFPDNEYLLIENRQKIGFDSRLPQGGLTIWHINDSTGYDQEGHPSQSGWPGNGNHYCVALLQADGNYDLELGANRGDGGDVWHASGVNEIGPSVSPLTGPFPNTDAYQGGNVFQTDVRLYDISASAQTMTFSLSINAPTEAPTEAPTAAPTQSPTPSPTPQPVPDFPIETLPTTLQGGSGQAGNMFDVHATKEILVHGMDIHTRSEGIVTVQVWTKPGSYIGSETLASAWTKIGEGTVQGRGVGQSTPLPANLIDAVRIEASHSQAFYVTLTSPDLRYTRGSVEGNVYASNSDLQFLEGAGKTFSFGRTYRPRIWNGALHYSVLDVHPPTLAPTPMPTFATNKELTTTFEGGSGQAGNMFDVVAARNVLLHGMEIHSRSTSMVTVEIYTKAGSYVGHDKNSASWTKIGEVNVQGQGVGNPIALPANSFDEVNILATETRAFYVTLTSSDMRYTKADESELGTVYSSNSDISVLVGVGKTYNFGRTFNSRVWNGVLHYTNA